MLALTTLAYATMARAADNIGSINLKLSGSPQALADATAPVAIARLDDDRYITANYHHLSAVDVLQSSVRRISVKWAMEPTAFVPAGLAYDAASRALFIANYTGNNILVGQVADDFASVVISGTISDASTVSPEGVAYDPAGHLLASAQYDGSSVDLFDRVEGQWRLKCSAHVDQAHGVAFAAGFIFATGLAKPQLVKLNSESCAIEATIGGLGWNALAAQFMWPTTIQRLSDGMIAVSDAHTGHISIVDPQTMTVLSVFGHNGPGFGGLNMPYGFAETVDRNLLITSTFGNRLIELTRAGAVVRSYSLGDPWPNDYRARAGQMLGPPAWRDYAEVGQTVSLFGRCFFGGYSKLVSCDGGNNVELPRPRDTLFSGGAYFYFSQIAATANGVVVVSPQNPTALYIAVSPASLVLMPTAIGLDSWLDGGAVLRPAGNLALNALVGQAGERAAETARKSAAAGGLSIADIVAGVAPLADHAAETASIILGHFRDAAAKSFVEESARCADRGCRSKRWCEISGPMAERLHRDAVLDIVELATASQMNSCLLPTFEHPAPPQPQQPRQVER